MSCLDGKSDVCRHSYRVNEVKDGPLCLAGLLRPETLRQVQVVQGKQIGLQVN